MSHLGVFGPTVRPAASASSGRAFLLAALTSAVAGAALAGWAPVGCSIATVFLFAGPHNWIEARYFLARLPGRWGRLRPFFLISFGGILALTATFAALPWMADCWRWTDSDRAIATASWNTGLVVWIAVLTQIRSQTNPRRDWSWLLPVGFALICFGWLCPNYVGLGLVYLHPIMALWLLDRELLRRRPGWVRAYRGCLASLPLFLAALWFRLADSPDLPGQDVLTARITRHAGAGLLTGVSTHLLVATHTFLEMLHYAAWLVAIPLVGFRAAPWKLGDIPLARRAPAWRTGLLALLLCGAIVVLTLWAGFLADYVLTRDVYFTVALLHVLAEAPFLLRAL